MAKYVDLNGLLYFKEKIDGLLQQKIDKNQGALNSGKFMKVGADGNLVPEELNIEHGVTNYGALTGKPQINSIELNGNKTLSELGITPSGIGALPSSTKIPTDTKDLTNGADFQSGTQVENKITGKGYQTASQVQSIVNNAVKGITSFEFKKVDVLPSSGQKGIIYLVPNKSSEDKNVSDEYIWDGIAFELLGTTRVDLSGYYNSKNFLPLTNTEIDTIFA